jgi:hypothetical protein
MWSIIPIEQAVVESFLLDAPVLDRGTQESESESIFVVYTQPDNPDVSCTVEVRFTSDDCMGNVFAAARHELIDTEFATWDQFTVV